MREAWIGIRAVALLVAGAVAVHELRYTIGPGDQAGWASMSQGHSYMPLLEALAGVLVVMALVRFAASVARARRGIASARPPRSFGRCWTVSSAALFAVYVLQETFEGAVVPGRPGGVIGVFGNGGWTALLLAASIGALIALLLRSADGVIELVARRLRRSARPARRVAPNPPTPVLLPRLDVIACHLAGRAPPVLS